MRRDRVKPSKPYADFPLFPHATGRWAKKIKGKLRYFGPWGDPDAALKTYLDQRDDLHAGRTPGTKRGGLTVADLANEFLTSKRLLMQAGELTARSWRDYYTTCEHIVRQFGKTQLVHDLAPTDFDRLKAKLARTRSPVTVGNEVNRVRVIVNWAFEQGLIEKPVRFGPAFRRPPKRIMRLEKAKQGPRMLEAHDVRKLLDVANPPMRAMILLGINAGLGNTDVADLQRRHVDLDAGWLVYPRPKTGIGRRCKLWPETVAALRTTIATRQAPKQAADAECVLLTVRGERVVRIRDRGEEKPGVVVNAVTRDFARLMKGLGLTRPGIGFYALRHSFETIAGEGRDQVAVDVVMGHADQSMGGVYRERVSDERLAAVAEVVRGWLWPAEAAPATIPFSAAAG